ncbi:hypothetical protein [Micromonospora inositola]|uniref:Uncharacterized protein n=1 Tax=Micromonospora inositola TaxID=47865 RepID=A0A1C5JWF2_9ACTN|nr:hypothetical protein [Micromonospora inositola]SCG74827.1 hypothetical protein GA0070613_5621 [Micromonospora inositola]
MLKERESGMRLSDEEFAAQRRQRFGRLPAQMRPEDYVVLIESSVRPGRPAAAGSDDEWMVRNPCL